MDGEISDTTRPILLLPLDSLSGYEGGKPVNSIILLNLTNSHGMLTSSKVQMLLKIKKKKRFILIKLKVGSKI